MKRIESVQNPLVKNMVQLLEKSKARKQQRRFVVEGLREVSLCLSGGYKIEQLLFCPDLISSGTIRSTLTDSASEQIEISKEVYQKLAYRETTEGILAIAVQKSQDLKDLKLSNNPLILVAESPEKPGNLGALLRTADAAHIDAVIVANPLTDLYNPNVIRSSVGCVFTTNVAIGSTNEVIEYLQQNNIAIYSAILQEALPYHTQNFQNPTAIVVGTEATGLTEPWRTVSTQNIIIPMEGEIDSMNVSVAAAILLFEAKRQRY